MLGITNIERMSDFDRIGIPVYACVRLQAAMGALSIHSGKGLSDELAKASLFMEVIEKYSAEFKHADEVKVVKALYRDLKARFNVLDPTSLIFAHSIIL